MRQTPRFWPRTGFDPIRVKRKRAHMKNKLKEALKKWKWLQKTVSSIKWHPRRVSYGKDNPDKTFYIIRRHDLHAGLFSFVSANLGAIRKVVDAGYIPVVDMAGSPNSRNTAL
mgnify:CR=1 FL=1